jgi:hypothetical protein
LDGTGIEKGEFEDKIVEGGTKVVYRLPYKNGNEWGNILFRERHGDVVSGDMRKRECKIARFSIDDGLCRPARLWPVV